MRDILERRFKLIKISNDYQPSKWAMIALLRKLPVDARIMRTFDDFPTNSHGFIAWSGEWDIIPLGHCIPDYTVYLTRDDELDARDPMLDRQGGFIPTNSPVFRDAMAEVQRRVQAAHGVTPAQLGCTCDLKYTGAKTHAPGCPLK